MDANCEVVRVVSDCTLIDSESYERRYLSVRALVPGFYAVIWPSSVANPRYDNEAQFIGPYRERSQAERILEVRGGVP